MQPVFSVGPALSRRSVKRTPNLHKSRITQWGLVGGYFIWLVLGLVECFVASGDWYLLGTWRGNLQGIQSASFTSLTSSQPDLHKVTANSIITLLLLRRPSTALEFRQLCSSSSARRTYYK